MCRLTTYPQQSRQCSTGEGLSTKILGMEDRTQKKTTQNVQLIFDRGAKAIQWSKDASEIKVAQSCLTLCDPMDCIYSPGQNTGVGSLSLLQGIFPTQGSNPGLLHFRWILYQLSHQGSPRLLNKQCRSNWISLDKKMN